MRPGDDDLGEMSEMAEIFRDLLKRAIRNYYSVEAHVRRVPRLG